MRFSAPLNAPHITQADPTTIKPPLNANAIAVFTVLFFLALILRLLFVLEWQTTPYGAIPLIDAQSYDEWARIITKGQLFRDKAFYQSPLYPYFLSFVYLIFGSDVFWAAIANAILSALTCLILSWIAFTLFGIRAAILSGLLAAFSAQMIFYVAPVMKETLVLFCLSLFLAHALQTSRTGFGKTNCLIGGLLLGISVMARGNALFLLPVFLWQLIRAERKNNHTNTNPAINATTNNHQLRKPGQFKSKLYLSRNGMKKSGWFILGFLASISPATVHNAIVSHDFVPINYADGFNFYLGHFSGADGISYKFPEGLSSDPHLEEAETTYIAARHYGHAVKPSEVSRYWLRAALQEIYNNPIHELHLIANKFAALFSNAETFDNYDIPFYRQQFAGEMSWPLVSFGLVMLLSTLAIILLWQKSESLRHLVYYGLAYSFSLLCFYITDRYRLPLWIFIVPAAGGLVTFLQPWPRSLAVQQTGATQTATSKKIPVITIKSLIIIGCGLLIWWPHKQPDLSAYNWAILSKLYDENGELQKASDAAKQSLSINALGAGSMAFRYAAISAESLGQYGNAEHLYDEGLKIFPTDSQFIYEYARFEAAQGRLNKAEHLMRQSIQYGPTNVLAHAGLVRILVQEHKQSEAEQALAKAITMEPQNSLLLQTGKDLGLKIQN